MYIVCRPTAKYHYQMICDKDHKYAPCLVVLKLAYSVFAYFIILPFLYLRCIIYEFTATGWLYFERNQACELQNETE